MMNRKTRLFTGAATVLAAMSAASGAFAQSESALSNQRSTVISDQAALAGSTRATPSATVAAALQNRGVSQATTESLIQTAEFTGKSGVRHARFEQRIDGLRVYGANVKAAFNAEGRLIHLIDRVASANGRVGKPTINDAAALQIAIEENFGATVSAPGLARKDGAVATFMDTDFFYKGPSVERVIVARGKNLEEGFLVETWSDADNLLYHTLVDGIGRVVSSELRTADDSYNIFPIHPGSTPQTVVNGPGAGNTESPQGWLSGGQTSRQISGNNVSAYLDQDANNVSDGGGVSVTDGNFLTTANLGQDPRNGTNPDVSVQNVFYFSNVAHDRLYTHGFVEATGNFQENNFGNGGAGSDSLNAEALDGSGTNNANFATPSDGSNPRMQMFRTTYTNPNRDTGIDADVIWHEYGHGLTWRMIGSMSGSVSGAIGEGASDTLAIIITDEDRVGEWSFDSASGIRSSRYEGHPKTLASFTGNSVHGDGEIYAAAMWDVFSLYKANGFTADDMMDDFVGGMNFTPAGPTYLDMRDGLLAQAPAARQCLVWEAYAGHGMGEGASFTIRTGGNPRNRIQITESYSVPSSCQGGGGNNPPAADFSASCTELACSFTDASSDSDGSIVSWSWNFGDGNSSSSQNPNHTYAASGTYNVSLTVTDDDGATDTFSDSVTVSDQPSGNFTLSSSGFKVRGVHNIDLNWSGSAGGSVDIYRNGSIIATVGGSSYTDNTGAKGGATYTHQVCDAGTSTCSNTTTTTF